MSELPEDVQTVISNLDTSLSSLEEHLGPLLEIPWDDLTGRLDPMEKAKLNLMMAYSTASLFYMYLKSQGASTDDHPIQSELTRIHSYIGKLKEATANADTEKARLRLNTDAAQRFIKAGLSRKDRKKEVEDSDAAQDEDQDEPDSEPLKSSKKKSKK